VRMSEVGETCNMVDVSNYDGNKANV